MKGVLTVFEGDRLQARVPIEGDQVMLGSAVGANVRLSGPGVGLCHALMIDSGNQGVRLVQAVGAGPITVNGEVRDHAWIRSGDMLGIGPFRVVVVVEPSKDEEAPAELDSGQITPVIRMDAAGAIAPGQEADARSAQRDSLYGLRTDPAPPSPPPAVRLWPPTPSLTPPHLGPAPPASPPPVLRLMYEDTPTDPAGLAVVPDPPLQVSRWPDLGDQRMPALALLIATALHAGVLGTAFAMPEPSRSFEAAQATNRFVTLILSTPEAKPKAGRFGDLLERRSRRTKRSSSGSRKTDRRRATRRSKAESASAQGDRPARPPNPKEVRRTVASVLGDLALGARKSRRRQDWGPTAGAGAGGAPRWGLGGAGGGGSLMNVLGPGGSGGGRRAGGSGRLGSGGLSGLGAGSGTGLGGKAGLGGGAGPRLGRSSGPVLGQQLSFKGSGLSRKAILEVLQAARNRIRFCYETRLRGRPDLSGRIEVGFTVVREGTVGSTKILGSQVGDQVLESCLLRVVQGLRFPGPKGGGSVEIRYSWFFRSEEG